MMTLKTKASLFLCFALLTLGLSQSAFAEQDRTRGMMEFKLGPYLPAVDSEFGGDGPYAQFFGDRSMLSGEFQLDFHLWQGIGKLSLGTHVGYGRVQGRLRTEDGEVLEGAERVSFRTIPLRTSLVYRFDYGAMRYGIPLVPVVKAGLDYHLWRVSTPDGETAESGDGARAAGGRAGWHATAGLHLHLNVIDRRSAAAFAHNWGIKNTYFFGEYTLSRIDGFGSAGIDLSDNHWAVGLAFEF